MGLVRMEEWLCPQHGCTLLPTLPSLTQALDKVKADAIVLPPVNRTTTVSELKAFTREAQMTDKATNLFELGLRRE